MATEKEWNGNINSLRNAIDNWSFRMDLTDDEMKFLDDILFKLMDDLEDARWDKLQKYLKDVEEEDD